MIAHRIRVRNRGNPSDFVDGGVPRDSRPGSNKMSVSLFANVSFRLAGVDCRRSQAGGRLFRVFRVLCEFLKLLRVWALIKGLGSLQTQKRELQNLNPRLY